jgi:hypothetical protein
MAATTTIHPSLGFAGVVRAIAVVIVVAITVLEFLAGRRVSAALVSTK